MHSNCTLCTGTYTFVVHFQTSTMWIRFVLSVCHRTLFFFVEFSVFIPFSLVFKFRFTLMSGGLDECKRRTGEQYMIFFLLRTIWHIIQFRSNVSHAKRLMLFSLFISSLSPRVPASFSFVPCDALRFHIFFHRFLIFFFFVRPSPKMIVSM